jgi:hypothetical protein
MRRHRGGRRHQKNQNIKKFPNHPEFTPITLKTLYFSVLNTDQTLKMLNQNKQIETPKIKFLFLLFSGIGTKKINLDSSPP